MVGRDLDFRRLAAQLQRAVARKPGLVLIRGEAGIGKSRIIEALSARAGAAGGIALTGGCAPLGLHASAFGPLVEAFRVLPRHLDEQALANVLGRGRPELARLIPALGEPQPAGIETRESRILEHVFSSLARLSDRAPVVFVVEDIHWADAATRDLLRFLAYNLHDERILVVLSARSDELSGQRQLASLIGDLVQLGAIVIDLAPLGLDATQELLTKRGGGAVTRSTAAEIHRRAGGNPFYCELLQDAAASGQTLPGDLQALLLSRVARVSRSTRGVLNMLAVVGGPASDRLLETLTRDPGVQRRLREAVSASLLTYTREHFQFRHALLREAVLYDLLPGERARLHRRVAEVLTALPELGEGTEQSIAVQIASHWYESGERTRALHAAIQAAREIELASPRDALQLYERAIELSSRPTTQSQPDVDRVELMRRAAEAAFHADDTPRASALVQDGLREVLNGSSGSKALLLEHLGRYLQQGGNASSHSSFESAANELTPDDLLETRARVLASLGLSCVLAEQIDRGAALLLDARDVVTELDDPHLRAMVLLNVAESALVLGDLSESIASSRAARRSALEARSPDQVIRSYTLEARATYLVSGRMEDSIGIRREGFAFAEEHGQARTAGSALRLSLVEDLAEMGSWNEALGLLEGLPLADRGLNAADGLLIRWFLAIRRGDPVHLTRSLVGITQAGHPLFESYFLSVAIPIASGLRDLETVQTLSNRVIALCEAHESVPGLGLYLTDALSAAIEAEANLGDRGPQWEQRTGMLLRTAEEVFAASRRTVAASVEFTDGVIQVARAEFSRGCGTADVAAWEAAATVFRSTGARPRLAYALWRKAEAMLQAGEDRIAVKGTLAEALSLAADLGARPWQRTIAGLARQARVRLDDVPTDVLPVTPRELEVLGLVAQGLTDKEIAKQLVVSPKTASAHVAAILSKLEVRNRSEAVARFYGRQSSTLANANSQPKSSAQYLTTGLSTAASNRPHSSDST